MQNSNLLRALNLNMNNMAGRAIWIVGLPTLLLALLVYALSQPIQGGRFRFVTGAAPALRQAAKAAVASDIAQAEIRPEIRMNGIADPSRVSDNFNLVCDVPVTGTLRDPIQRDFLTFNVTDGETVTISLVNGSPAGGNFQVVGRLLNGSGSPVAGQCGGYILGTPTRLFNCGPLPAAGNPYRIEVVDSNLDDTGAYRAVVSFLTTGCPACAPNTPLPRDPFFSELFSVSAINGTGDRVLAGKPVDPRAMLAPIPLPIAPHQLFCEPVELAPGRFAVAFVPTPQERNGDFSPFAGLLIDPQTNAPFPGGMIPANRIGPGGVFAWRIAGALGPLASVSAASFSGTRLASESIVAAFGSGLATATQAATVTPLPTRLAGTIVKVKDSANVQRDAPLFFTSATQTNYQIPPMTAEGKAFVSVVSGNGAVSMGTVQIAAVAPGLFSANANGQGVAAAVALRVTGSGLQVFEPVSRFDPAQNRFVSMPIDLGPESDQVFLLLFGTGYRNRSSLSATAVRIGGMDAQVSYAGPAPGFVGLDQANARIPRSLIGRGEVNVSLVVDGQSANIVQVNIR